MLPAHTSELRVPRIAAGAGGFGKETFPKPEDDSSVFSTPQSRAHFPALAGWWTKIRCDLALSGLEKLSRLVLGSVGAAGAASCYTQVLEWQLWLPWDRRSQRGWGKHHSVMPASLLIPPRGNKTGQRVTCRMFSSGGIWKCSPSFLPVLLTSFATPEAR